MIVECLCCYEPFSNTKEISGFCSKECLDKWLDNLCFTSNCNDKFYNKKRRVKVMAGDKINRIKLSEDFGWICQLCFTSIHPNRKFPDNLSSTVDHIIPLSRGGEHIFSNVQPAHLKCNIEKGNKFATG